MGDPVQPMRGLQTPVSPRSDPRRGASPAAPPTGRTQLSGGESSLPSAPRDAAAWQAAQALEAGFLAEMLKSAGLGEVPESFGGGVGEEQFASFLRERQAEAMVAAGGIGLAEHLYQSIVEKPHER